MSCVGNSSIIDVDIIYNDVWAYKLCPLSERNVSSRVLVIASWMFYVIVL